MGKILVRTSRAGRVVIVLMTNLMDSRSLTVAALLLLGACSAPKPRVPSLTPQQANELLNYNPKAKTWMIHVKRQNPACEYRLDLPDQTSQPTAIDLDHIVVCNGRPSPKEFDAAVSFAYDPQAQTWAITRFSD
jgi:hypothetical protein